MKMNYFRLSVALVIVGLSVYFCWTTVNNSLDADVDRCLKINCLLPYDMLKEGTPVALRLLGLPTEKAGQDAYDVMLRTVQTRLSALRERISSPTPREEATAVLQTSDSLSDEVLRKRLFIIDRAMRAYATIDPRSGGLAQLFQWCPTFRTQYDLIKAGRL